MDIKISTQKELSYRMIKLIAKKSMESYHNVPIPSLMVLWRSWEIGMGPDPTQAYFWPALNKRWTCLWLWYFLTQPDEILFIQRENVKKNWFIVKGIGWPNPSNKKMTQTGKIITWTLLTRVGSAIYGLGLNLENYP